LTDKARIEFQQMVASQGVGWERMAYQEILSLNEALVVALRERDFATQQWRDWNAKADELKAQVETLRNAAERILGCQHYAAMGEYGWDLSALTAAANGLSKALDAIRQAEDI
jgi:outer membrane murein-binding lipoprotein Lpp